MIFWFKSVSREEDTYLSLVPGRMISDRLKKQYSKSIVVLSFLKENIK